MSNNIRDEFQAIYDNLTIEQQDYNSPLLKINEIVLSVIQSNMNIDDGYYSVREIYNNLPNTRTEINEKVNNVIKLLEDYIVMDDQDVDLSDDAYNKWVNAK